MERNGSAEYGGDQLHHVASPRRAYADPAGIRRSAQPYLPGADGALLDWTAPDDVEARAYVLDRDLAFQCRPDGTTGSGLAEVALDYLEVRVRYSTGGL